MQGACISSNTEWLLNSYKLYFTYLIIAMEASSSRFSDSNSGKEVLNRIPTLLFRLSDFFFHLE